MYSSAVRQSMFFTRNLTNRNVYNNLPKLLRTQIQLAASHQYQSESKRQFHSTTPVTDVFKVQDEDDFKSKVMKSKKPVIVEFHADWCGPCKQLMPRLEKIVHGLKGEPVDLAKVDIDDLPDIAMEFGVGAVPSVLGIKGGKVIDKFVGLQDEDKIKTFISKISK